MNEDMYERLIGLLRRVCRAGADCDTQARRLLALYQEPIRHYHNLGHIRHCLEEFDAFRSISEDPDALETAIWFHDAIYDPARDDNESRSAELARKVLSNCGSDPEFANRVADLVMVTLHDRPPLTTDGKLLADIDLTSLGQTPERFDREGQAIRQEHAYLAPGSSQASQMSLLKRFLDRPHVYYIPAIRERYEQQARANLGRALSILG